VGQVQLNGTLTFGPSSSGGDVFPSSIDSLQLATTPNPKPMPVATGTMSRNLQSPNTYITLSGVGTNDTVQQADTFYLRCDAPIKLRLTIVDPAGGADIVAVIPHQGTMFKEFPTNGYLKLVEAMGSARMEYAVSGLM